MINQIRFGMMAPPLTEQLAECEYDAIEIGHCQRLTNAANDLWIANMMTDNEVKKVRSRIGKRIFKAVQP